MSRKGSYVRQYGRYVIAVCGHPDDPPKYVLRVHHGMVYTLDLQTAKVYSRGRGGDVIRHLPEEDRPFARKLPVRIEFV